MIDFDVGHPIDDWQVLQNIFVACTMTGQKFNETPQIVHNVGVPIGKYKVLPISNVRFNSKYFDRPDVMHDPGEWLPMTSLSHNPGDFEYVWPVGNPCEAHYQGSECDACRLRAEAATYIPDFGRGMAHYSFD